MADQRPSWRKFQRLKFSTKSLSRRARKAEAATVRHAHRFIFKRLRNIRNVRQHIALWMLLVGVLLGAASLQLFWFQQSYTETAAVDGGTYAEGVLGPLETLNPLYASTDAERSASRLLFSSLYGYDTNGNLRSDLVKKLERNKEGDIYTVHLRDDAKWSDGTDLTANDVVFTVDLLKNPMARTVITGWQDIEVEALDDRTVRFSLPSTYAPFMHAMTFPIVPKHILENVDPSQLREAQFSSAPVTSGVFSHRLTQTVDMTADRKIVHMVANDRYYKGAPKLEKFQLHVYGDQEAIARAVRTSEVNAAANVSLGVIDEKKLNRYSLSATPINNGVYALLNTESEVLKDVKVRRALQRAADTDQIRSSMPQPVQALDLPFFASQVSGNLPRPAEHDVNAAKKLLDEAGYTVGEDNLRYKKDVPLKIRIATLKNTEYEAALTTLARQWKDVGVEVEVEILDANEVERDVLQTVLQPRNFDVLIYELTMGADADSYAYWHSSQTTRRGLNFSNYANGIADDALASARLRVEPELRDAKYIAFARQWLSDVPAIGLYRANTYYIKNPTTTTFDADDSRLVTSADRYGDVLYWSVRKESVYKTP